MAIPVQLQFSGDRREFQFRDNFVMPLLIRLGFGVVVNYHGQREFGRDVIFGDVDRFGHVVYYGMQIKYESSISLTDSHGLIRDAEEATHNSFRHPQTGCEEYISCFYVANAGDFSDQARENFFSTVMRRGIRDARLLDGNALLLLDRASALNRTAFLQERLTGMLQEIRRNRSLLGKLESDLRAFVGNPASSPFPMQRCRNTAAGDYLSSPFPIPGLPVNVVDQYWEATRMFNYVAESLDGAFSLDGYRAQRFTGIPKLAHDITNLGAIIEQAADSLLSQLSGKQRL